MIVTAKPNKIQVGKSSKFYNRLMKSWLQISETEMYLTHNKQKSVIAERFIRTLKNVVYKYDFNIKNCVY